MKNIKLKIWCKDLNDDVFEGLKVIGNILDRRPPMPWEG